MNKEFIKDIEAVATDVSNVIKDGCEITIDPFDDLGNKVSKAAKDIVQTKDDVVKAINDISSKESPAEK